MFKKKKKQEENIYRDYPQDPYYVPHLDYPQPSGSPWSSDNFYITGAMNPYLNIDTATVFKGPMEIDVDALWEKMYTRIMRVVVVCSHCSVPQTIDNGSCMKCGAPLPLPTFMDK